MDLKECFLTIIATVNVCVLHIYEIHMRTVLFAHCTTVWIARDGASQWDLLKVTINGGQYYNIGYSALISTVNHNK